MQLTAICRVHSWGQRFKTQKLYRVMKLTAIFLLTAGLGASAKGISQTVTLDMKNTPVQQVFKEVIRQTGVSIVYNEALLKDVPPVTINVKNVPLKEVLDMCLSNLDIEFSITDNTVEVRKKIATDKFENVFQLPPPSIDVYGRVVNNQGNPVEGATITVKGTNRRVSTDANGNFNIAGVDGNAILVISAVNIETFEVKINGKADLGTLNAKNKIIEGENVTISTGYQHLSPNEVTGSVVSISNEQLDQRVSSTILDKLEGITNGLVFNKDPLDGTSKLRIRGESTIFGYTNPLLVVDNFPYPYEKINDINPNDVENITILKDAAAASIWGAQAGNGVIVITTKHGRANQPLRVELNANTTITKKPDLFYKPYISPSDYIDIETFLFNQGFYSGSLSDPNIPAVSPVVEILNSRAMGLISASDSASQINALRRNDWRNEYLNYLYRTAITQQYQISLSGGGSKVGYYFSAGYDKELANVIGNDNTRITFNNRTTYAPLKNLDIQVELDYLENTRISNGILSIGSGYYPYMQLKDENANQLAIPQHRAVWEDTIANHGFLNWKYYPLQEREMQDNNIKSYSTRLGASIRYTFFRGLSADASYQYYRSIESYRSLINSESFYIRNQMNRFAIISNGNYIGSNYPAGGQLNLLTNNIVNQNGRLKLNYNYEWRSNKVTAIAGIDINENQSESNSSRFYGYDASTGSFTAPNVFTSYSTFPSGSSTIDATTMGLSNAGTTKRFRSYFSNVTYAYKEKYSIYGSARLDQANIFGVKTNEKGTPLWSLGGKWNITKEKFYNLKQLPLLGLRLTYGYQGNLPQSAVAIVTFKYGNPATYTGLPTATINNYPNPELRWEKLRQLNIGLDFSTKNETISGYVEYFTKSGKDLIGDAPIDPTTGIAFLRGNFSDMKSMGFDILMNTQNIKTSHFRWGTTFIFNYAAEKVTRYDNQITPLSFLSSYSLIVPHVGYPLHSVFSYQWAGLDPLTGDPRIILGDTINKSYTTGTTNGIKFNDLVFSGRYNPPYAGSLLNNFTWKNLSLSINIAYKFGHYFIRNSINYAAFVSSWMGGHTDYNLRWQKPGDEQFTNVPSFIYPITSQLRDNFYLNSNVLVQKGDHVRLQYINLNYRFNNSILKKLKLQDLNIYFYANNLGILWRANKYGIDPDYPYLSSPPSKSFSFGIKTSF